MNRKTKVRARVAFAMLCTITSASQAAIIYNESVSGDLSNNQAAPNAFLLSAGTNSILGSVGPGDSQDWVALTVPTGFQLSSLVLASYQSADAQGFTGLQVGSSFVGSPFTAASYLGYSHFGTGATNGPLPPTNLVGADLLPIMSNPTLAPGSQGFTPPLPSGTYTFLIQQTGGLASYGFDYNVTAAPVPGSLTLIALGACPVFRRSRSRRQPV